MNILKPFVILFWLPIFWACNSNPKENCKLNDSLQVVNNTLKEQLKDNELLVNNFLKSFNEIQDNLESIKSKEKIITLNSNTGDLSSSTKDNIINDITIIYGLLNKNKQALASMKKKLEDSNIKNAELEKLNLNLIKQVLEQEKETEVLKNKLNKLNIILNNINIVYEKMDKETDKKISN